MFLRAAALLLLLIAPAWSAEPRTVTQGNGKLVILDGAGQIEWEMPWEGIHDIHTLSSGHFLVQRGAAAVVEIDPATRQVVWEYDSATANGNSGKSVEVHSFQPLEDGGLMIAESGPARIIEIDRNGAITHEMNFQHQCLIAVMGG